MEAKTTTLDWRPFFPEANVRPLQEEILDEITNDFDKFDVFMVEAPAGTGKSCIAITLARWLAAQRTGPMISTEGSKTIISHPGRYKTFITTTTIGLETQYMRSYRRTGLRQLHSASHFPCSRKNCSNCEEGRAICNSTKTGCPGSSLCPYKLAKEEFMKADYGIVNAAYLITESFYAQQLGARSLLIADEGHTLCDALCNFYSFRLTPRNVTSLGLIFPKIPDQPDQLSRLIKWLTNDYQPRLLETVQIIKDELQMLADDKNPSLNELSKRFQRYSSEIKRLAVALDNVNDDYWVMERGFGKDSFYALNPISAKGFARPILESIAPKLILLSATLIDFEYHQSELDIDPARLQVLQAPSPFPIANRLIHAIPSVKLDYTNITGSALQAAPVIQAILESHPGQRGIIFTSSYAQAHALTQAVNQLLGTGRLLTHQDVSGKEFLFRMHGVRRDSVIVSPSMHEGVDLKGELSESQIIAKLPFPNLGSSVVQKRMAVVPGWYHYQTVLKIIQASGRSIRSENDQAPTYILDVSFATLYSKATQLFPEYWQAALQFAPS